jgi:hypothetical protein
MKAIELSRDVSRKLGYLEILEIASIVRQGKTWFLVLNEGLIPECPSGVSGSQHFVNGSGGSITSFSLSPISACSVGVEASQVNVDGSTTDIQTNKQTTTQ